MKLVYSLYLGNEQSEGFLLAIFQESREFLTSMDLPHRGNFRRNYHPTWAVECVSRLHRPHSPTPFIIV